MKHAVIILAHKDFTYLQHLIAYFSRDCCVFVHIDRKSSMTREQRDSLSHMPQVAGVYSRYAVHWGGFSILRCEIFMLREALRRCEADYVHLISGQDYPVRPLSRFLDFFENNKGQEFLQYMHLPNPRWEGDTFRRFLYYYPYDWIRNRRKSRAFLYRFLDFQRRWHIRRSIPAHFEHLYGNSQWFSITRHAAAVLTDYTRRHPSLYRRMWMTFAPEESYVATVLVNLLDRKTIRSTNMRLIRWAWENGNRPANLGREHFRYIVSQDCLFARKMEKPYSVALLRLIDRYLLQEDRIAFRQSETGAWIYGGYLRYGYDEAFMKAVFKIYRDGKLDSVLDMGCGAGLYVAALRQANIPAAGYDANPHVEELSANLLPADDEPCHQADLTDDLEVSSPFDLVLCKDVLPFIPAPLMDKAVCNLKKLTGKYLLLTWYNTPAEDDNAKYNAIPADEQTVVSLFGRLGFVYMPEYTASLRDISNCNTKNLIYVFKT